MEEKISCNFLDILRITYALVVASKQASEQASEQASKQAIKNIWFSDIFRAFYALPIASEQASERAIKLNLVRVCDEKDWNSNHSGPEKRYGLPHGTWQNHSRRKSLPMGQPCGNGQQERLLRVAVGFRLVHSDDNEAAQRRHGLSGPSGIVQSLRRKNRVSGRGREAGRKDLLCKRLARDGRVRRGESQGKKLPGLSPFLNGNKW